MKHRTVKVNLYHVKLGDHVPDFSFTSAQIQEFLNEIFLTKINVDFEVRPVVVLTPAWDLNGNGKMEALPENDIHTEQQEILDARPANVPVVNIDIFLMSGGKFQVIGSSSGPLPAVGVTNRGQRACWINAETLADPQQPASARSLGDVCLSLAHEVGHIFTDYGHPDEEDGVTPLKGTDRTLRLMHSGESTRGGRLGDMLVKEEWDAAEKWLKSEEANKRL